MELKSCNIVSEYKTVFNEDGSIKFVKKEDEERGKKSKRSGGQFELRVRKDLEEKGWIVDKWSNNVDLENGKIIPVKRVFKKFKAKEEIRTVGTIGTGFPDFIAFQLMNDKKYKIIGVEVKINGLLGRIEKEKCKWYLENKIFSEILVARKLKEKNRVRVEYNNVSEILKRMR